MKLFTTQYAKFWTAIFGAIVIVVTQIYGEEIGAKAKEIATAVEAVVTALLVAAVPNAQT